MKTLSGAEYEIKEARPVDIPAGAYFGYSGARDISSLEMYQQISAKEYRTNGAIWIVLEWRTPETGSCPLHPLKGLCLDGVTR